MGRPKNAIAGETLEQMRQRITNTICTLMAEGQSLRRICRSVDGMPAVSTFCMWMNESPELAEQYARARVLLADARFDEYRDAYEEFVRQKLAEGWEPKDANTYARNATANMQWEISKLGPKYSDKGELVLKGDPSNPLQVISRIERVVIKPGGDTQD